jgi:AcrR family transcriptional regulator
MGIKDVKFEFILNTATELFMTRNISDVTIKDIADAAGVGEATVYRYFKTKNNIVVACAINLGKSVYKDYFDMSKGKTGYDKLEMFYKSYLNLFKKSPSHFYFVREFDAYMIAHSDVSLVDYEKGLVDQFANVFIEAYEAGLADGSVKEVKNVEIFYFATTHALLELCKKLSMKKGVLEQDKTLKKTSEIKCLINVILSSLQK